uniref:Reverse transcriptase domain-containing protein n=1 Tax=Maylandia zebra TaxID=106582 RepID=A0A3P9DFP2_9CICH
MPRGKTHNTQATSLTTMAETPDGVDARCPSQDGVAAELTSIRSLLEQVAQDMTAVKGGIESLKEAVNSLGVRVDETETRISRLEDEEAKASSICKILKIQNQRLQEKVTALEGSSRRQNIRISGIREGSEGSNIEDYVKNLLSEALDIEMGDYYEIDRIHRVGPAFPKPTADSRPRHIIKILTYLKQKKTDIALIQETHLDEVESLKLKRDWVAQVYFSAFSARKRGVVILIRRNLDFQVFKHYTDQEGRWVVLDACLQGRKMTLVNIYAPNSPQPQFFHEVCNMVRTIGNTHIVIGGDFNRVRDVLLDKSSCTGLSKDPTNAAVDVMSEELSLVDIWRLLHPQERDYTFFSHPHSTYSRIDYFLVSRSLASQTIGSSIGNIAISDHAPIDLVLTDTDNIKPSPRWRLNNSILKNKGHCECIREMIKEFWLYNEGSIDDVGMTWDAFKAYLRGRLIQYCSLIKKAERDKLMKLEQDIKELEKQHMLLPERDLWNKLIKFKFEMNSILEKKVEYAMFYKIYNNNKLTTSKKEINDIFTKYYQELYTSNGLVEEQRLSDFFSSIKIPSLSEDQRSILEGKITLIEVKQAIGSLRVGKSPGNDGFPSDFYKVFVDELAPRLLSVYQDAFQRGRLPFSMRSAVITLLHKKGKDPQHCGNYRPISLINVDEKIISKILAFRLEKVLPYLVHRDQVGFVKNRSSADNLRRVLHILWKSRTKLDPVVAFSLDAEKAFDKVEYPFLFHTLKRFGFGPFFRQWIQVVYTDPMATVITNGIMSPSFSLSRGTRQGSPLSPLIFALFLEPLAIALRECKKIRGVDLGQEEHKTFLYADDILLISTNPEQAVPAISSIIDSFSVISGYTINWSKSEAMPISKLCPPVMRSSWHFKWMPEGLTYLGIKLTPGVDNIMKVNISPVIQNIRSLLQNWVKINLSLLGRINLVKMIIAPKLQYFLHMLPIAVPHNLLKLYNTCVEGFVWAGKKPLFNRSKLYAAKESGGLALSKMVWYHYAFSLSQLVKIHNSSTDKPSWVGIEESLVAPSSLEAFLTQKGRPVPFKDPVLSFMQETWLRAHQYTNSSPYLTARASIWYNKKVLIGKKPVWWEAWARTGINQMGDLFGQTGMKSFAEIRREFNLDPREIWRFFQIRHCIKAILKNNLDPPSSVQKMFATPDNNRIRASKFYRSFREAHAPSLGGLRRCWEKDLGIQISEDSWKMLISSWYVCSPEIQSQLIQYKLLHRNYWTPSKLVRLKLADKDICWKCQQEVGTLVHMLYTCRKNDYLWDGIINLVNDIFKLNLSKSPAICVLGLLPDGNILSKKQRLWMRLAFITGCRVILRHWKSSSPCSFKEWTEQMSRMASYERVMYRMKGREDIFEQVWEIFFCIYYYILYLLFPRTVSHCQAWARESLSALEGLSLPDTRWTGGRPGGSCAWRDCLSRTLKISTYSEP